MAADVLMPRLNDSMEEGTILRWLKTDGDAVTAGDELVEIETDKSTVVYAAEGEGVLQVVAAVGETLPVGAVIARLGGEPIAPVAAPAPGARPRPGAAGGGRQGRGDRRRAEPGARCRGAADGRVARDHPRLH